MQRVDRVLSLFSSRWNWDSPTLSPASECVPPPPSPTPTNQRAREWRSPNSDDWRKSLALCLLCDGVPLRIWTQFEGEKWVTRYTTNQRARGRARASPNSNDWRKSLVLCLLCDVVSLGIWTQYEGKKGVTLLQTVHIWKLFLCLIQIWDLFTSAENF